VLAGEWTARRTYHEPLLTGRPMEAVGDAGALLERTAAAWDPSEAWPDRLAGTKLRAGADVQKLARSNGSRCSPSTRVKQEAE